MKQALIIDDDEEVAALLSQFVRKAGLGFEAVHSLKNARGALGRGTPDLILLDQRLPDGKGLDFLAELKGKFPQVPVIMITGEGEVELAVKAMRAGARDFLTKPVEGATLLRAVKQAVDAAEAQRPADREIIGDSPAINEVWRQIDTFAHTDITVLLLGESGTGKELFARAVHARSKRRDGPFIELDCASIAPSLIESELFGHEKGAFTDAREARAGKFELASGGTLFLDEIGNLSLEVQAKLLRVVQERRFRRLGGAAAIEVDVRIVAATNLELEDAVRRGAFRNDLYFRLAELPLRLPGLRERQGDVRRLVEHFVADFAKRYQKPVPEVTPDAMRALEQHPWPGNVRELLNVVRAAVLRAGDKISPDTLASGWGDPARSAPRAASGPPAMPISGAYWPAAQNPDAAWPQALPSVTTTAHAPASVLAAPVAPAASTRFAVPWPANDEDGLDVKKFLHDVRAELEIEILSHLLRTRGMSKAQMARYLKLDYKVLLDKLRTYGLTSGSS